MNIEFIKSEIKRLTLIVDEWREGEPIPAVERDLALDKIKSLYEVLRFGEQEVCSSGVNEVVASAVATATGSEQSKAEETAESDVEVEFIFAEEDEDVQNTEQEESVAQEEPVAEPEIYPVVIEPIIPVKEEQPVVEKAPAEEEKPAVEVTPEEATPAEEKQPEPKPQPEPEKPKRVASINSLFGADEPRREPRSKHQRMMSIYNDDAKPEKVVDISKIFEMDDDEDVVFESVAVPTKPKQEPKRERLVVDEEVKIPQSLADANKTVTLADAMAQTQSATTLADTIAAPAALGEEINHSHIRSLRRAIGINDKFLMIRDLFDGDSDVYEKTISALDEFEEFDDCLLYIAENHPEWNPDSEGAKFLTQLLERKLL